MTRPTSLWHNTVQWTVQWALERLGLRPDSNTLLPFSVVAKLRPYAQHHRGVQPIPTECIRGSVDRHQDFDRSFRRKAEHLEDRWARIRQLWESGHEFPAIEVYRVGELYFVRDGNHRVSVARSQGQAYIDADVIEIEVLVPPAFDDTLEHLLEKSQSAQRMPLPTLRPAHA